MRRPGAALALIMALVAVWRLWPAAPPPAAPPVLPAALAMDRPDGGQNFGQAGAPPNALSGLNLGRKINFAETPPELLAALPGLGPKNAVSALDRGCLTAREKAALSAFVDAPVCD